MPHPSSETLVRFANATARKREAKEVVRHLLHGCNHCSVILGTLVRIPVDRDIYGPIFRRAEKSLSEVAK